MLSMVRYFADVWTPLGLIWILQGFGLLLFLWKRKWLAALVCGITATLLLLAGSDLSASLLSNLEQPYTRSSYKDVPTNDVIVVLGGGHQPSRFGTFSLDLTDASDRILTGLELMRQGKGHALVLGGGAYTQDGVKHPYSALLRVWLEAWHLPNKPVFDLGTSMNTREEALAFERLARDRGWRSVTLVTSASHMRRAEAVFRNVGFPVVCVATDFRVCGVTPSQDRFLLVPRQDRIESLNLYMHESIGWQIYRWKGWTEDRSRPGEK